MDTFVSNGMHAEHNAIFAGGGEMGRLMRQHDWAATLLGPVETWPQSLRTVVSICLSSGFPMLILWGPEHVQFYNDAFCPILGTKHPRALGQRASECWAEIWTVIQPMFAHILAGGEAVGSEDQPFLLDRYGYTEETFFTFSYSPIRDETGNVGGIFCTVKETTRQILSERRVRILRELAARTGAIRTTEEACQHVLEVLSANAADIPLALLYLLDTDANQAHLMGTSGISADILSNLEHVSLNESANTGARAPFFQVSYSKQPFLVEKLASLIGSDVSLLSGAALPDDAFLLPIARAGETQPIGLLMVGISLHRAFDEEYRGFFELVAAQIATALANARAHEEERQRAETLTELDRAKTTFFSNVSHEFRTPLTLLLGPVETLLAAPTHTLTEEQRELLRMVQRNGLRQLKLVNTLLDFSRIEAGRVEALYLPTDLAKLTIDLASAFRSLVQQAGLQLRVECAPLPEPIYVDRDMWEKIVLNLLSNAFKFTLVGFIRIALYPVEAAVELVVQDTGIGVREEECAHLFERFYRVHAASARTQEGSGIGLALVQELVRLHGGSISVQSAEGAGTTFTVRLPTGNSHLPVERLGMAHTLASTALGADSYVEEAWRWLPDRQGNENNLSQGAAPLSLLATPLLQASVTTDARSRLLVVDDNADMRDYLKRLLSSSYHVMLAPDGTTALALARATRPDLLIADVMMPGLDGFALLKALRSELVTEDIPVILLSARAGEEATLEGLRAGAADYLVKPFSAREVLARVQARLEIAHLRREAELARERLHDLFMQAPAIICVLRGPLHIYELANAPYYQLVGQRELLGKPMREALPELEGQGFYEMLDQVYATGEAFIGEEVRIELERDNTGKLTEGYFNFVYQPLRTARGEIDGVMVHAVEVTEQVRIRQRMNTFLGIASHELKNPLTSIRGNVNLALRRIRKVRQEFTPQDGALRELFDLLTLLLERAERQILFQNRLVSDLVDTTRIQTGKLELHTELVDLHRIVRDAVDEQRQLAPARTIQLEPPADATYLLVVDADRIGQAVTNYLSNALKYSAQEQPVSVQIELLDQDVRVSVRDAGPGLALEQQEHIWERFYRVPGVEVKSGGGTGLGLGLHICRTIIEEHGGRVGVESEPGKGSTFWFTLPFEGENAIRGKNGEPYGSV